MKTRLTAFCLFAALAVTVAVVAQAPPPRDNPRVSANVGQETGPVAPSASHRPAHGSVRELVAILDETRSVDTFLLTATALAELGSKAKPAVQAIIRNGERLQVLKDHATQTVPNVERMRCAQQVHQAVIRILKGDVPGWYGPAYGCTPGPFFVPQPLTPVAPVQPSVPVTTTAGAPCCPPTR
jgi:hypothetical protein